MVCFFDEGDGFQRDYRLCRNRQREDVGRVLIARAIISLSLGNKEKYQYSVRGNLCRNLWQ